MSNEDYIEELLHKAYQVKKGKEVIERSTEIIKTGVERSTAFYIAYLEIVKDEIHRKRHTEQGETREDDSEGS